MTGWACGRHAVPGTFLSFPALGLCGPGCGLPLSQNPERRREPRAPRPSGQQRLRSPQTWQQPRLRRQRPVSATIRQMRAGPAAAPAPGHLSLCASPRPHPDPPASGRGTSSHRRREPGGSGRGHPARPRPTDSALGLGAGDEAEAAPAQRMDGGGGDQGAPAGPLGSPGRNYTGALDGHWGPQRCGHASRWWDHPAARLPPALRKEGGEAWPGPQTLMPGGPGSFSPMEALASSSTQKTSVQDAGSPRSQQPPECAPQVGDRRLPGSAAASCQARPSSPA